ncbi:MAG: PilZ domain-containing protein [Planctomycetes bacterium]|nr:PilZ domain-containing protein [Planctomycetota bacterium]
MTQITKLFSNLAITDPAVWLAISAGLIVVFVFLLLGRRKRRAARVVVSEESLNDLNPADVWLPPSKRSDERRRATRRLGVPTPVKVLDPRKPKRPIEAFVLDRSSGGVRMAAEKPFPTGTTMQIRPSNAHEESPWVTIIVRSCREVGDHFELGCQFQEELPIHILLLFG